MIEWLQPQLFQSNYMRTHSADRAKQRFGFKLKGKQLKTIWRSIDNNTAIESPFHNEVVTSRKAFLIKQKNTVAKLIVDLVARKIITVVWPSVNERGLMMDQRGGKADPMPYHQQKVYKQHFKEKWGTKWQQR